MFGRARTDIVVHLQSVSTATLADASKSVGALKWNSLDLSPKTSAVGQTWWSRPLTGSFNANDLLALISFLLVPVSPCRGEQGS
jgi:hypothetical protein